MNKVAQLAWELGQHARAHLAQYLLVLALFGAVYSNLCRFEGPIKERYVPIVEQPGGVDFAAPYLAAMVYLRGDNPYHHNIAELKDPLHRFSDVFNGHQYDFVYGPTHILPYVPLAYFTHGNWHHGHRAFLRLNLCWCLLLAWIIAQIVKLLRPDAALGFLFMAATAATLALCPALNMLLERGQSDLFISLLCWASVFFALKKQWGLAIWLCLFSVFMKPYAVALLAGLIAFALIEKAWRSVVIGLACASVYLAPVWKYIPVALQASFDRSQFFGEHWTNHGFLRLFRILGVTHAEAFKFAALGLGALVCALLGLYFIFAARYDELEKEMTRRHILVYFATTSFALALGASNTSILYNLIVIIPGLLVMAITLSPARPSAGKAHSVERWLSFSLIALACLVMFWAVPKEGQLLPTPALSFIAVFVVVLVRSVSEFRLGLLRLRA